MFYHDQPGPTGLFLKWQESYATVLYIGEVYYHLGLMQEAEHSAFEAMVGNPVEHNSQTLRRLVTTSIIERDSALFNKYIRLFDHTLFYRRWAAQQHQYMASVLASCHKPIITQYTLIDKFADIYPKYEGTVIPPNIAPFNFNIREMGEHFRVRFSVSGRDSFEISSGQTVKIPLGKWKNLLERNRGNQLEVTIFAKNSTGWAKYKSAAFFIAEESIDPYIAYRLIEPGYTVWNKMGLYQRNLEDFDETPILLNSLTDNNCMNCHSFCKNNPETMLFHLRKRNA